MYVPDFETFKKWSQEGNLIPVYREILADTETPVSALIKHRSRSHLFLLESAEGGEKWGRYTCLGTDPRAIFRVEGGEVVIEEKGNRQRRPHQGDPLRFLKELLARYRPVAAGGLPRFYGGAVGFLGYDMVRFFEKLPSEKEDPLQTEQAVFLITDTLLIFDNVRHTVKAVACMMTEEHRDLETAYAAAIAKIEALLAPFSAPLERSEHHVAQRGFSSLCCNLAPEDFKAMVNKAKEYISAGDIIQVVLSQRFQGNSGADPIRLYRALRYVNPSPYLFFLKFNDFFLIGSSPEVLVRLEEGVVELKPIAGTKKRGKNEQEDRALADALLRDPKERAEHVMLVDLGRNDLGRIARTGSVQINRLMAVERYSHVMHLVSHIQAHASPDKDAFDVLQAAFPAGTLTGAPKIRAMEIIDELESSRRGPYGGAVGYFSFNGNMDFCITIRTMMLKNGGIFIQSGAGIVADSDPEEEYRECLDKAKGLMLAIRLAESGLDISRGESSL